MDEAREKQAQERKDEKPAVVETNRLEDPLAYSKASGVLAVENPSLASKFITQSSTVRSLDRGGKCFFCSERCKRRAIKSAQSLSR